MLENLVDVLIKKVRDEVVSDPNMHDIPLAYIKTRQIPYSVKHFLDQEVGVQVDLAHVELIDPGILEQHGHLSSRGIADSELHGSGCAQGESDSGFDGEGVGEILVQV